MSYGYVKYESDDSTGEPLVEEGFNMKQQLQVELKVKWGVRFLLM
jgi:hypothetical protein